MSTPPAPFTAVRLRFGHFLELSGPGWEERAKQLGVEPGDRDGLVAEFSGRVLPIGTELASIVAILGEPFERVDALVRYDLGVRSDYLFEFLLNTETQTVLDSDYVRRNSVKLSLVLPRQPKDAIATRSELIRLGVTAKELRAAFGEPQDPIGWWPIENWTYPGLSLELRLGVVEEPASLATKDETSSPQSTADELRARIRAAILAVLVFQVMAAALNVVRRLMPPSAWDLDVLMPFGTVAAIGYGFWISETRPVATAYLIAVGALVVRLLLPTADATTSVAPAFLLSWLMIGVAVVTGVRLRRIDNAHP